MTLFEALTGRAFDRVNWQDSGEFDQNFSKKSNRESAVESIITPEYPSRISRTVNNNNNNNNNELYLHGHKRELQHCKSILRITTTTRK